MRDTLINWITKKLTTADIRRLCEAEQTTAEETALIVHSDDMPFDELFPNRTKVNIAQRGDVDIISEKYYEHIPVADASYDAVICSGLLEHVPDPQKTIDEFTRIVKPGGKIVISASFAFSNHNNPDNYFHFTTDGLRLLFERSGLEVKYVQPSCKPFRTIGILLQRIGYQTKLPWLFKIPLFLVAKVMPVFDGLIIEDHGDIRRNQPVASSLHSNTQGVAIKPQ